MTDLQEDLPRVALAAAELKQALGNVFINAVEAMADGGVLTVRTSRARPEHVGNDEGSRSGRAISSRKESVVIECLDTGKGIARDKLPQVFDPFFTTKPTGPNSGLGLSVARKIIQLHNGIISVENRADEPGAKVVIHLPAVVAKG